MFKVQIRKEVCIKIFMCIIVLGSFSGLTSFLDVLSGDTTRSWAYGVTESNSFIDLLINYGKDIFVCLLFALLCMFKKINHSIEFFLYICGFFLYSVILILNGNDLMFIIAGIRMYIYAISVILMIKLDLLNKVLESLFKLIPIIIAIHSVAQVLMLISYNLILGNALRLPGLANSAIALGYLCVGYSLILMIGYACYKKIGFKKYIIYNALCVFLSLSTGTRVSMICVMIIFIITVIVENPFDMKSKFCFLIISMFVFIALYYFIIEFSGRGNIMDSGSMRIEFFSEYILNSNLFEKIFGCGIGTWTNNAINMQLSIDLYSVIIVADSTFGVILGQCGVLGLVIYLYIWCSRLKMFFVKKNSFEKFLMKIVIIICVIITMLGTNIYEQSIFCQLLLVSIYALSNERGE